MIKDEELGNVKVKGSLGCSKHDILQFSVLKEVSNGKRGITSLEFRKYFRLFRNVLYGIPQKTALQGKVAQDRWLVLMGPFFSAHEQAILTGRSEASVAES